MGIGRVTGGEDELEAGAVDVFLAFDFEEALEEDRGGDHRMDFEAFDVAKRAFGVEDSAGDHGAAHREAQIQDSPTPGVEHRCGELDVHVGAERNLAEYSA